MIKMSQRTLFARGKLYNELNRRKHNIVENIRINRSDEIITGDLEALASSTVSGWAYEPLRLLLDAMTRSEPQNASDGTSWTIYIPFEGDSELLDLTPNSFNMNPPFADVERNEILIEIVIDPRGSDGKTIDSEVKKRVGEIEWWISNINAQLKKFDDEMRSIALKEFKLRRERLIEDDKVGSASNIPVRGTRS